MTTIESAVRTVLRRCATISVVRRRPLAPGSEMAFCNASETSCWLSASSALVASSRIRIVGSRASARAIASRCFCPPLNVLLPTVVL
mmetsp:Transcript_9225/g.28695  ORF Transcript_9225/g.28695 Transcript_9225/m.28695 type:complete len:87 (-) Transcript_9225:1639-1899(-)